MRTSVLEEGGGDILRKSGYGLNGGETGAPLAKGPDSRLACGKIQQAPAGKSPAIEVPKSGTAAVPHTHPPSGTNEPSSGRACTRDGWDDLCTAKKLQVPVHTLQRKGISALRHLDPRLDSPVGLREEPLRLETGRGVVAGLAVFPGERLSASLDHEMPGAVEARVRGTGRTRLQLLVPRPLPPRS